MNPSLLPRGSSVPNANAKQTTDSKIANEKTWPLVISPELRQMPQAVETRFTVMLQEQLQQVESKAQEDM